jgi:hypothetical protein
MYIHREIGWGEAMNRAREQAIRTGLAIVENHRAAVAGLMPATPAVVRDRSIGLDQARLDIPIRSRISRLPWRGQFAPELIDYFMDTVCRESRTFLDPFCGSGTVLFEAVSRGHVARGSEVNPAAWYLASLACFAGVPIDEKKLTLHRLKSLAVTSALPNDGLFSSNNNGSSLHDIVRDASGQGLLARISAAVILLGMRDDANLNQAAVSRGAVAVLQILNEFINSTGRAECELEDARKLSVASDSMDAIITSPPYINVFNYHQNYRMAVELLGWRPLEAARSEIGANRKHRMNRFLTVVQYCLDMSQCIDEMARILRLGAPLVIVLGRTSNVLGTSFKNGSLFSRLLALSNSFGSIQTAYRVFTNRFGEQIFEDILIAHKERSSQTELEDARDIGLLALRDSSNTVPERNRYALDEAISRAKEVMPSPLLQLSFPTQYGRIE